MEFAHARSCYGHLAGELAVTMFDSMLHGGWLVSEADTFVLTETGRRAFESLGVDVARVQGSRRAFIRSCLDLTERRPHLAGALGDALLQRLLTAGWVERQSGSRTLALTPAGRDGLRQIFGS